MMCDLLARMIDQAEVLVVITFIIGLLLELFPKLVEWDKRKKILLSAGIGFIIPVGAFFIGAANDCWVLSLEIGLPYLVAGLIAAVGALGGNLAVKAYRAYRSSK